MLYTESYMNEEQSKSIDGPQFSAQTMNELRAKAKAEAPQKSAAEIAHDKAVAEENARALQQQMAPKPSFMTEPLSKTGPSMGEAAPIVNVSELRQTPTTPDINSTPSGTVPAAEKIGGFKGLWNKLRGK